MSLEFSIIIPTKNRPEMLSTCLSSIAELDCSAGKYEVIVIDDGSEYSMAGISERFANQLPIQFFRHPLSIGPGAARNTGAENAKGKYLVFLDDDCVVDPNWLRSFEMEFARTDPNALVGSTRNPDPEVIGAQVWCLVVAFLYDYWQDEHGNLKVAITNNFAVEKEAFTATGGFDPTFSAAASEDRDFSWRFNQKGYQIAQSPEAVVWHSQPTLNMVNYLKLQFRYGYFAGFLKRKQKLAPERDLSERFGSSSRLRYAFHLLCYAIKVKASISEIAVLFLGHISHYVGRIYQTWSTGFHDHS